MIRTRLSLLSIAIAVAAAVSCSGEATTRKKQEKEFLSAFGFAAPSAVVEIKYKDLYNRGLMDGAYAQWMRFTYSEEVFQKILEENAFKRHDPHTIPGSATDPDWWVEQGPNAAVLFSKTHKDTEEDEGFSFRAYLWHDAVTGFVYFQKSYWD